MCLRWVGVAEDCVEASNQHTLRVVCSRFWLNELRPWGRIQKYGLGEPILPHAQLERAPYPVSRWGTCRFPHKGLMIVWIFMCAHCESYGQSSKVSKLPSDVQVGARHGMSRSGYGTVDCSPQDAAPLDVCLLVVLAVALDTLPRYPRPARVEGFFRRR